MKKSLLLVLALISIYSNAVTKAPEKLDLVERHKVSGLNSHFPEGLNSFDEYISHYQNVVSTARTDLNDENRAWVIEGNTPFQLKPADHCEQLPDSKYQRGVVLGHGLTDSVYQIKDLARYFQQQCFYVMALLLPGHGTRPGDSLEVSWKDWVKASEFGINRMAEKARDVYMAGYSTGGTLALLAASQDKRIKGVFAFSPAVKVSSMAAFAGILNFFGGFFDCLKWLDVMPDDDYFKYESFSANAAAQIHKLTKATRKSIDKNNITVPVFTVASAQDTTIEVEATVELMKQLKHEKNQMLLYSQYDRQEPAPITVVNSHFPQQRQLSLAHTGLSIPANDPHYGEQGSYRNCGHYYDEGDKRYVRCKDEREILTGEKTRDNLRQGILRRGTYNYLYSEMLEQLGQFIKTL